jgi:hypothetical protein
VKERRRRNKRKEIFDEIVEDGGGRKGKGIMREKEEETGEKITENRKIEYNERRKAKQDDGRREK